MHNFTQLAKELNQDFSMFKTLESLSLPNPSQIIVSIYTHYFSAKLEIFDNEEIKLVFPYEGRSKNLLSTYFNYPFDNVTPIYSNKRSVLDSILPKEMEGLSFHSVIKHFIYYFLTFSQNNVAFLQALQFENQKISVWQDMAETLKDRQFGLKDTILKIQQDKLSVTRFGDGEIKCMLTNGGCVFQQHDWQLMRELREISKTPTEGLLVCYSGMMTESSWWHNFWYKYWAGCKYYLPSQIGDAMISRPEAFYFYGQEMVVLWKSLWENKQICVITGRNSRFDIEHFMFDNVQGKTQILTSNRNAYSQVNQIMDAAMKVKADVFLIALGPAGTVLASRLHKAGKWALDIGHLNNSYNTVFLDMDNPEAQ